MYREQPPTDLDDAHQLHHVTRHRIVAAAVPVLWHREGTMSFLRRNHFGLAAALLAALVVLFVSTASLACEGTVDQGMMSASMTDDSPCEHKTDMVRCQKACLVFCQGLVSQSGDPASARIYAPVRYPSRHARHADFAPEADDPPPRS